MENIYSGNAWEHANVLQYYERNRLKTNDVYPSEWLFLKEKFSEGMNVLDIGCAKGFIANVLSENVRKFSYCGIDTSEKMISAARKKFPNHRFYKISENDYSVLKGEVFDLVVCVGVLSVHEAWRDTLSKAWSHTKGSLIVDLREITGPSIEDKSISYLSMNFEVNSNSSCTVPYNLINASEAQAIITSICSGASKISHFGYLHAVSNFVSSPIRKVMTNVYCCER